MMMVMVMMVMKLMAYQMPVSKVLPLMISKLVPRVEMAKSEERESQLAQRTECFV